MTTGFSPAIALIGGLLIGLSSTLLLLFNGRIAGISGIVNGAIGFGNARRWQQLFIVGLLIGGLLYSNLVASQPTLTSEFAPVSMIIGGLLVGFGTRLGNGCTSGHGVCGLGRLSFRSLVAVMTFLIAGFATVFVTRHLLRL